jgi:hypothetical protein
MMRHSKNRLVEAEVGRRSQELAEAESKLVPSDVLDEAITEFIEWRAFLYWVRLCIETGGSISDSLATALEQRCPGFLEYATAYATQHPNEPECLWRRLLDWLEDRVFQTALTGGWRHALGYYATRDPRMDQLRAYWNQCHHRWKIEPPESRPCFESWCESAFQIP